MNDPIVSHLCGQVAGALVIIDDTRTSLGSTVSTLIDVSEGVVQVPGLDEKAAASIARLLQGDVEQLDRIRAQVAMVRQSLTRAAQRDRAAFGRALRA